MPALRGQRPQRSKCVEAVAAVRGAVCVRHAVTVAVLLPRSPNAVVYTAMHGVGAPFVRRVFEKFGLPAYVPVPEQLNPDPAFPTVEFPNPEVRRSCVVQSCCR